MLAHDSTGAMKITSKHEQISSTPSREKSGKNNEPRDRRDKMYDSRPVIPRPPNIPWPPGIPHL